MEIFTKERDHEREPLIVDESDTDHEFHYLAHARESVYEDKEVFPEGLSDDEGRNAQSMAAQKKSSFPTVVYSIINTAVGGSIFGYPYVYSKFGILFGVFMTIFGAVLTCFGSAICQKVKNLSKHSSYASIANACYGQVGRAIVSIVIVINALGSCLTYFIVFTVVAENLLRAFISSCDVETGTAPIYCQKHIYATLAALVILPFNFRKTFTKLKTISMIKVISIMLFTSITVVHAIYVIVNGNMGPNVRLTPKFDEPLNIIAAFPQVMLGYNFLYNQFTLYKTMEGPSDAKLGKAVNISMAFAATVCMLVGLFGYLIFGDQTTNILKNYSKEDLGAFWYLVLNFAFLASSMTGIPVTFFPARNLIYHSIIRRLRIPDEREGREEDHSLRIARRESIKKTTKGKNIFRAVVVGVTILILVIAIVTPDLNTALGFIGSIGINCINFLFPMAFYIALSRKRGHLRRMAYAVIVFSVFVGVGGLVANSIKIGQQRHVVD